MDGTGFDAAGLLCGFHEYDALRNGEWRRVTDAVPERFERIRFSGIGTT